MDKPFIYSYKKALSLLFSISLLGYLRVFFTWDPFFKITLFYIPVLLFVFLAAFHCKIELKTAIFSLLITILVSYFYTRVFFVRLTLLSLFSYFASFFFFFYSTASAGKHSVLLWKYFIRIFAIVLVPGLVIYFLRFHFDFPFKEIDAINPLKTYNYLTFAGSIFPNTSSLLSLRFHGVYDEPGALGTYAALILGIDRFRNKIPCIIILFSGIISFSLAFYVLALFNAIFIFKNKFIWIVFIIAALLIGASNEDFKTMILSRIAFTEEGLSGDNRDNVQFKQEFDKFISIGNSISLILGNGSSASHYAGGAGGSSLRMLIYDYGILGFLLSLCVYFIIFLKHRTTSNFMVMIAFFLSMYQRPGIYVWGFLLIFYIGSAFDKDHARHTYGSSSNSMFLSNLRGVFS